MLFHVRCLQKTCSLGEWISRMCLEVRKQDLASTRNKNRCERLTTRPRCDEHGTYLLRRENAGPEHRWYCSLTSRHTIFIACVCFEQISTYCTYYDDHILTFYWTFQNVLRRRCCLCEELYSRYKHLAQCPAFSQWRLQLFVESLVGRPL